MKKEVYKSIKNFGVIVGSKDGSLRDNDSKKYEFNDSNLWEAWKFLRFG